MSDLHTKEPPEPQKKEETDENLLKLIMLQKKAICSTIENRNFYQNECFKHCSNANEETTNTMEILEAKDYVIDKYAKVVSEKQEELIHKYLKPETSPKLIGKTKSDVHVQTTDSFLTNLNKSFDKNKEDEIPGTSKTTELEIDYDTKCDEVPNELLLNQSPMQDIETEKLIESLVEHVSEFQTIKLKDNDVADAGDIASASIDNNIYEKGEQVEQCDEPPVEQLDTELPKNDEAEESIQVADLPEFYSMPLLETPETFPETLQAIESIVDQNTTEIELLPPVDIEIQPNKVTCEPKCTENVLTEHESPKQSELMIETPIVEQPSSIPSTTESEIETKIPEQVLSGYESQHFQEIEEKKDEDSSNTQNCSSDQREPQIEQLDTELIETPETFALTLQEHDNKTAIENIVDQNITEIACEPECTENVLIKQESTKQPEIMIETPIVEPKSDPPCLVSTILSTPKSEIESKAPEQVLSGYESKNFEEIEEKKDEDSSNIQSCSSDQHETQKHEQDERIEAFVVSVAPMMIFENLDKPKEVDSMEVNVKEDDSPPVTSIIETQSKEPNEVPLNSTEDDQVNIPIPETDTSLNVMKTNEEPSTSEEHIRQETMTTSSPVKQQIESLASFVEDTNVVQEVQEIKQNPPSERPKRTRPFIKRPCFQKIEAVIPVSAINEVQNQPIAVSVQSDPESQKMFEENIDHIQTKTKEEMSILTELDKTVGFEVDTGCSNKDDVDHEIKDFIETTSILKSKLSVEKSNPTYTDSNEMEILKLTDTKVATEVKEFSLDDQTSPTPKYVLLKSEQFIHIEETIPVSDLITTNAPQNCDKPKPKRRFLKRPKLQTSSELKVDVEIETKPSSSLSKAKSEPEKTDPSSSQPKKPKIKSFSSVIIRPPNLESTIKNEEPTEEICTGKVGMSKLYSSWLTNTALDSMTEEVTDFDDALHIFRISKPAGTTDKGTQESVEEEPKPSNIDQKTENQIDTSKEMLLVPKHLYDSNIFASETNSGSTPSDKSLSFFLTPEPIDPVIVQKIIVDDKKLELTPSQHTETFTDQKYINKIASVPKRQYKKSNPKVVEIKNSSASPKRITRNLSKLKTEEINQPSNVPEVPKRSGVEVPTPNEVKIAGQKITIDYTKFKPKSVITGAFTVQNYLAKSSDTTFGSNTEFNQKEENEAGTSLPKRQYRKRKVAPEVLEMEKTSAPAKRTRNITTQNPSKIKLDVVKTDKIDPLIGQKINIDFTKFKPKFVTTGALTGQNYLVKPSVTNVQKGESETGIFKEPSAPKRQYRKRKTDPGVQEMEKTSAPAKPTWTITTRKLSEVKLQEPGHSSHDPRFHNTGGAQMPLPNMSIKLVTKPVQAGAINKPLPSSLVSGQINPLESKPGPSKQFENIEVNQKQPSIPKGRGRKRKAEEKIPAPSMQTRNIIIMQPPNVTSSEIVKPPKNTRARKTKEVELPKSNVVKCFSLPSDLGQIKSIAQENLKSKQKYPIKSPNVATTVDANIELKKKSGRQPAAKKTIPLPGPSVPTVRKRKQIIVVKPETRTNPESFKVTLQGKSTTKGKGKEIDPLLLPEVKVGRKTKTKSPVDKQESLLIDRRESLRLARKLQGNQ